MRPCARSRPQAGVGVGTFYRHFPKRSDLVAAVFRREVDACAAAAAPLANKYAPAEALARWLSRYAAFIDTKRGLAAALHSGDPTFDSLPAYFDEHLGPALQSLLDSAVAAEVVRADIRAHDLLRAISNLCVPDNRPGYPPGHGKRMIALLLDGLAHRGG